MNKIVKNIGITLLLSIFALSLVGKLSNFDNLVKQTTNKNIPFPYISAISAIAMLFVGTFGMLLYKLGYVKRNIAVLGIDSLVLFTTLATYYFHNILIDPSQKYAFQKNLSIIGGLLHLRYTLE